MVFFVTFLANGLWLEARSRSPSVFNGFPLVISLIFISPCSLFVLQETPIYTAHILSPTHIIRICNKTIS